MNATFEPSLQPFLKLAQAHAHETHPATLYRALDTVLADTIGHTLFTILRYDDTTNESARIYSNMPAAYPTSTSKPLSGGDWVETVLTRGEAFIGKTPDDLRAVFADHELIFSLGIGSIMNVPVMLHGRCRGIVNLSHDAGHYGDADIPPARILAGLLSPVFG